MLLFKTKIFFTVITFAIVDYCNAQEKWQTIKGAEEGMGGGVDFMIKEGECVYDSFGGFYACKGNCTTWKIRNRYNQKVSVHAKTTGYDCDKKFNNSYISATIEPGKTVTDWSVLVANNVEVTWDKIELVNVKEDDYNRYMGQGNALMGESPPNIPLAIESYEKAKETGYNNKVAQQKIDKAEEMKNYKQSKELTQEANIKFDEGKYAEAKMMYEEVVELNPDSQLAKDRIKLCDERVMEEKEQKKKERSEKEIAKKKEENNGNIRESYTPYNPPKSEEQLRQERVDAYQKSKEIEMGQMDKQKWENQKRAQEFTKSYTENLTNTIANGIASNDEDNFSSGEPEIQFGFNMGFDVTSIRLLVPKTTYEEKYDGNQYTVLKDEKSKENTTFYGLGINLGLQFHPYFSDNFGIGGYLDGTMGLAPMVLFGGGSSTYSIGGSSSTKNSSLYYKFRYGGEVWAGGYSLKFLGIYEEQINGIGYHQKELYAVEANGISISENVNYDLDLIFRNPIWGGGLRFFPFDGHTTLDVVYLRSEFLKYNWGNPEYSFARKDLIPSQSKIRLGLWCQSYFKFDFTFGWGQRNVSHVPFEYYIGNGGKGFTFEIKISYTKNWFSAL